MMEIPQGHMYQPDLRVGYTLPQPLGCPHLILVQFILTRLNIDGHELICIGRCQAGANLPLNQRVSAPSELFLAVAAFAGSHAIFPGRTLLSRSNGPMRIVLSCMQARHSQPRVTLAEAPASPACG